MVLSINIKPPIVAKKRMYKNFIIKSIFPASLKKLNNITPRVEPKIPPIKRKPPIS